MRVCRISGQKIAQGRFVMVQQLLMMHPGGASRCLCSPWWATTLCGSVIVSAVEGEFTRG